MESTFSNSSIPWLALRQTQDIHYSMRHSLQEYMSKVINEHKNLNLNKNVNFYQMFTFV